MQSVTPVLLESLARGWRLLRLSVDAPKRVPGWDWIGITAANDKQARIYQRQLERARHRGLIPETTRTCAVPDPAGKRIGSGGATLNALRHLERQESGPLTDRAILLIHAGGDSKRLPWASVPGKLFVPFPIQADPDHAVPTLFDHLLALAAPLAARADRQGIMLSLTGDVLPLFDADAIPNPENDALVVTTPASLDVAERHGVIVSNHGTAITRLLQKPDLDTMLEANALTDGAARIDTGIYLFGGAAVEALAAASVAPEDPLQTLLASDRECSLYEEIAWAMVPAHHKQLAEHPIGTTLLDSLGSIRLHHHNTEQFAFIHLGSSAEYLAHLAGHWYGQLPHRILAECSEGASPAGYCYGAQVPAGAQTGDGTAVIGAKLTPGVRLGNRCLATDFDADDEPLKLPDNCCLWQLPVLVEEDKHPRIVTLCCGIDDNPKEELQNATFCNRSFRQWMQRHDVTETELWPDDTPRTLWTARLFPALLDDAGLASLRWILRQKPDQPPPSQWRENPRLAMADLQRHLDLNRLFTRRDHLLTRLLIHALRQAVDGHADRNIAALAKQLPS
ncbi:MAG: fucose pyrophosphorylase domain-containing protein, partial [Verrucomicrobiota bacterium]